MFPERVAMYRKKKRKIAIVPVRIDRKGEKVRKTKNDFLLLLGSIYLIPRRLLVKRKVDLSGFCQKELCEKDRMRL